MTVSKIFLGTALAAAVVVGGSFAASQNGASLVSVANADTMAQPVKFSSAENTIKYRQNLMKAIGGHWGAIATTLKEGDSRAGRVCRRLRPDGRRYQSQG